MKTYNHLAQLLLLSVVLLGSVSCTSSKATQEKWYAQKEWLSGLNATPDTNIDAQTFHNHYSKHPERWQVAFEYLKNNELNALPLGKTKLTDGVTVSVEEYTTRAPGKEWLEGHKKKIDLQYIVSGEELHGTTKIQNAKATVQEYSAPKDVGFYLVPVINYHVIRPNEFSIFFPDDIHITNIQYGEKAPVRKIVFKIDMD